MKEADMEIIGELINKIVTNPKDEKTKNGSKRSGCGTASRDSRCMAGR